MASGALEVRVILYQEGDRWIAQGLEFDVTARGSSPPDAAERFLAKMGAELVMSEELGDTSPLSGVNQAPEKFWRMWADARMSVDSERLPIRLMGQACTSSVLPHMKIGIGLALA
jgi:hypothetical protein